MAVSRGSGSISSAISRPPLPETQPRFFGRRKGRDLKTRAKALVETLLPRLKLEQPASGAVLDPRSLFGDVRAVWLEIGFGGGEHMAAQAAANPDVGILGAEVFLNGIASLLGHVEDGGLANVRIFAEDVRRLLPSFPDASFERVFVLFPDPWPKTRHAERRFICQSNLERISSLLVDGGSLRVASDDPVYQDWTLSQMALCPDFVQTNPAPAEKPEGWPSSRYEMKARKAGRTPIFLDYRRRPRGRT